MALLFACTSIYKEKSIAIIDNRNGITAGDRVDNHKEKDVVISRVQGWNGEGKSYSISVYKMDNEKLKEDNPFVIEDANDYNKATYQWVNDSTLAVKLINASKNVTESFRLTYSGESASLRKID